MQRVETALSNKNLVDRVSIVTPLEMSILSKSYPPSAGTVAEQHMEVISTGHG